MRRLPAIAIFVCVFPLSVWIHAQSLRGTQPTPATPAARPQENQQPGEVRFDADNQEERDSGVWIDGKYFGYVKELRGEQKSLARAGRTRNFHPSGWIQGFRAKNHRASGPGADRQCRDGGESQSHLSRRRRGRTAPGYSSPSAPPFSWTMLTWGTEETSEGGFTPCWSARENISSKSLSLAIACTKRRSTQSLNEKSRMKIVLEKEVLRDNSYVAHTSVGPQFGTTFCLDLASK